MKAVLTYHSVDSSGSTISVTRQQLSAHLDALEASRTKVVRLESLHDVSDDENAVAITFDDGFANFASEASVELEARRLPATIFVVPQYVGLHNEWELADSRAEVPRLQLMDWDDLRALDSSTITVGAHGLTHRSLRGISRAELERELVECAAVIGEKTGTRPGSFAFPYGDFDDAGMTAASQIFDYVCTTEFALVSSSTDRHAIPRLDAYYFRDNDMLRRFGTLEFAAWVRMRHAARAARRYLKRPRSDGQ